jgi:hypothetical protein
MSRASEAVLSLSSFSAYSASLMSASRRAVCAQTNDDQAGSRMNGGYESSHSPGLPPVPAPRPRSSAAGGTKTAFEVMCLAERACVDAQSSASAARRDAAEMCRVVSVLKARLDSLERAGGSVEVLERVAKDLESRITRGEGDASATCSSISTFENHRLSTPGEGDALGKRDSVASSWRGRVDTSSSHLPSLSPSSSPPSRLHPPHPHASPTLKDNPTAQRGDADADATARRTLEAQWDAKSFGGGGGGGGGQGGSGGVPPAASPLEWDAGSVSGVPQASPLEISGIGGSSVIGRMQPLTEAGQLTEDDSLLSYLVVAGTGSSFDEGDAH